jgi:hypothetical protein
MRYGSNPYRYWWTGLLLELVTFAIFVGAVIGLTLLAAWLS